MKKGKIFGAVVITLVLLLLLPNSIGTYVKEKEPIALNDYKDLSYEAGYR